MSLRAPRASETVPPGLYRHYKGGLYQVLSSARHSETGEWFVVYRAVHGRQTWARPVEMFRESIRVEGRLTLRFTPVAIPVKPVARSLVEQLELFAA